MGMIALLLLTVLTLKFRNLGPLRKRFHLFFIHTSSKVLAFATRLLSQLLEGTLYLLMAHINAVNLMMLPSFNLI